MIYIRTRRNLVRRSMNASSTRNRSASQYPHTHKIMSDTLEIPSKTSNSLTMAAAAASLFLTVTLGLTAPFVVLRTPLPYMATPKHKVRRALESIPVELRRGVFVDLGSGDGEAVYQAAKLASFSKAIGYELNWTLWLGSQCRRVLFWPRELRSRTKFRCADFFKSELPTDTSVVMVFGVTPLMRPLSVKLSKECAQGTHILSYRFQLPTSNTQTSHFNEKEERLLPAGVVYDEEGMRIYRVQRREQDDGGHAKRERGMID